MNARVSSALAAVTLAQKPAPLLIGERLNAPGSAAAKKLLLAGDVDGLVSLAREQSEVYGAHCLDVCMASNELGVEGEKKMVLELVSRLSLEVEAPLMIDSTESAVIEEAVRHTPGRPIINSLSMDRDDTRLRDLHALINAYGVPFVGMCIGPDGMAKTARQKLDVARMLYEAGTSKGFKPEQFMFDVLTFPVTTGDPEHRHLGVETLDGLRLVKGAFPCSFTVLGVSNISFGMKNGRPRELLNSVFLYHAVRAGLDAAIVNVKGMMPYDTIPADQKRLADAVILDTHEDALVEYIEYFEGGGNSGGSAAAGAAAEDKGGESEEKDPLRSLYARVVERRPDGIADAVTDAVVHVCSEKGAGTPQDRHDAALDVLNRSLLPAMKEVGDRFGAGQLILPFVLRSAECMKAAVSRLESYLLKADAARTKGTIVLGTVYGDVHDIGKNLVKTILQNNGYRVCDLGKQVSIARFAEAIKSEKADAVGLSALLVSTSKQMSLFADHARAERLDIPILCGGAAINSTYINRIAVSGDDKRPYGPGLFYCRDMFAGLRVMDSLTSSEGARAELVAKRVGELEAWGRRDEQIRQRQQQPRKQAKKRELAGARPIDPSAHTRGGIVRTRDVTLDEIWERLDLDSLFKLSWGVHGRASSAAHMEDHYKLLEVWKGRVAEEELFDPSIVYGFFECHSDGDALVVRRQHSEDGGGGGGGAATEYVLNFPRSEKNGLCLADYFAPSPQKDTVALQAVTVGSKVTDVIRAMEKAGKYTDMYYLHGLATQAAEALADWCNARITKILNVSRTTRYSWGYSACPDVSQHKMVWELLGLGGAAAGPAAAAGAPRMMTLTESGQIVPEHSTAALVVHHPEARYF